jgi:multiple sugar transport system permease protein
MRKHKWHYVFVLPMMVLFFAFTVWPMIAGWVYAFFEWDGYGPLDEPVGFGNFTEALSSEQFWSSIRNTFAFTLGAIVIQTPLALLLALVLNNRKLTGRNLYRVLIFLPVVTTTAVIGIVFVILLNPWAPGAVNAGLVDTGLAGSPVNFLGEASTALPTIVAIDIWKDLGVILVYWLAALQTIPQDVYDSAAVDGVNRWQKLRYVTLPMIAPLGVIILLLVTVRSFNAFDIVWAMTQGGPNLATDIVQTYIYRFAFHPDVVTPRMGFASAAAIIFGVLVMLIAAFQGIVFRRIRGKKAANTAGAGGA